jgi:hypothetical protein
MNQLNNLYEVRTELESIATAVENAISGSLSTIERDLLLEKLRAVYDALLREKPTPKVETSAPPVFAGVQPPVAREIIDTLYGDDVPRAREEVPKTANAESESPAKVLNETFEDDFSIDLAAMLASRTNDSLRGAIGLNDRLMLLNDLFDQNAERYELTLDELDAMDNADDAYIYLHEHLMMDHTREGAKLLLSLIEKKFA